MEIIKVKNITFGYQKDINILKNIDFTIHKGTITVILGLNGCGKTTLIKLIAGLNKITKGEILLKGKSVNNYRDGVRSKIISYVPQISNTNIELTVMEFLLLSFSNQKNLFWHPAEKDKNKIRTFTNSLKISKDKLNKKMSELSGGERQIITIASALLQNSEIIVLDEPTAALDMKNQYIVLHFLKKLCKNKNKTIIFTCHDPNHALRLGGNTIALHNGTIFLNGESRKIITPRNLKKIYGESVMYAKNSEHEIITLGDF